MMRLLFAFLTAFTLIDGQIVQVDSESGEEVSVENVLPTEEEEIDLSDPLDTVPDPPQNITFILPDTSVSYPEDYATFDQIDNLMVMLANTSSVNQYLSTNLITYMKDIMQGYSNYKYVAYRSDLSDSNSGYLVIGKQCTVSGSEFRFSNDVTVCQFYRSYSGNTYYYNYSVSRPASYNVGVGSNVLLYTNVKDGYPRLESDYKSYDIALFGSIVVGCILILLLFGRKKS